jgi:serine/threonine-protein kinase
VDDDTPDPTPTGTTTLVGRVLSDRYRIENVVNAGANTVIAEAIDTEAHRPVTVKIVRPELAVTTAFRQAFRRQVEVAMSLRHPNIASVLGSGETELDGESTLFWVVEYLGGGSLRDLFDRGRLLAPSQALVVGLEACRALEAAHARGVVHTELTPSKLVFGEDARLRITDFAMAQLLGAEAWDEPATVATHVARYASPEQALSLGVDAKTDVYALSLCLIEAITGKVPFAGDSTVSTLAARVGKLMPVTADMSSLASVLERGGRPDAEDRWTAAEFAQALVASAEALPRPEPIPVLATSQFSASLAHRAAPAVAADAIVDEVVDEVVAFEVDATEPPAESAAEPLAEGAADPTDDPAAEAVVLDEGSDPAVVGIVAAEDLVDTDDTDDADAGDSASDVDAALPLLLLTDVADPPTGAVQVASDPIAGPADADAVGSVTPPPPGTAEMPAVLLAAAATGGVESSSPPPVDPTPSGILYDEERSGRPWGKYLLLGLVVLIGVAVLSYAGWLLLRTKSFEVPDLTGVDEAVARNEIAGNGWVIEIERERSDEVPEIDHVVRTVPVAGEVLDEGETFVIVVSDGFELRTLPELAGVPLAEAVTTLTDLRLTPIESEPEYSEEVPAGTVIRWQVQGDAALVAGAQVLPDTTIVLTASLGPEPRPAPNLANLTAAEATAALDALQLVTAQGEDVFSGDIEVGRVVTQTPPPETPVERGGTVTFQLSKGPDLVALPDLTGLTYPAAEAALAEAGYTVNSLLGTTAGTFVSASINGDEVQAGATFPRGTGVDLIFL